VADGICIRLTKPIFGRSRFTDPEILRGSLASVILRMKSLHLGTIESFCLHRAAPGPRDCRRLPVAGRTLGAVNDDNEPHAHWLIAATDPRVGRMIPEAKDRQALDEVLVIASALSAW
jgi:ATP-dependent helicase HrpA